MFLPKSLSPAACPQARGRPCRGPANLCYPSLRVLRAVAPVPAVAVGKSASPAQCKCLWLLASRSAGRRLLQHQLQAHTEHGQAESNLQAFLRWLVVNGEHSNSTGRLIHSLRMQVPIRHTCHDMCCCIACACSSSMQRCPFFLLSLFFPPVISGQQLHAVFSIRTTSTLLSV